MAKRQFSREVMLEAVKLVKERGVSIAQASRDLDVHENVLRKWVRDVTADPVHASPGEGLMVLAVRSTPPSRRAAASLRS